MVLNITVLKEMMYKSWLLVEQNWMGVLIKAGDLNTGGAYCRSQGFASCCVRSFAGRYLGFMSGNTRLLTWSAINPFGSSPSQFRPAGRQSELLACSSLFPIFHINVTDPGSSQF